MIECNQCSGKQNIKSGEINILDLSHWLEALSGESGSKLNIQNDRFELFKCKQCKTFWEWRPLYEETMYGGEPGEWVKVTQDYVKEHYLGVIGDQ